MKRKVLRIINDKTFLTFIFLIISSQTFCDIIIEPTHYVRNCIKITNVDDFPDICFIASVQNEGPLKNKVSEIKSNKCITICTFCSLKVYAVDRTFVTGRDIKKINWSKSKNALSSDNLIEPIPRYLEDNRLISAVFQYYKVAGFTDTSVVIYKWQEIYKFNTEKEDSVVNYNYTGDISLLKQNI